MNSNKNGIDLICKNAIEERKAIKFKVDSRSNNSACITSYASAKRT